MGNCVKNGNGKSSFPARGNTTFTSRNDSLQQKDSIKRTSFTKSMKSLLGMKSSKVENSETNDSDSLKNAIVTISYCDHHKDEIGFRENEKRNSLSIMPIRENKSQKSSYKDDTQFLKGNSIGRGLYGIVYNCLDAETGEIMALKIVSFPLIKYPHANTPSIQTDLSKFKEVFFRLNDHKNIIKYFEFYNDDSCIIHH